MQCDKEFQLMILLKTNYKIPEEAAVKLFWGLNIDDPTDREFSVFKG